MAADFRLPPQEPVEFNRGPAMSSPWIEPVDGGVIVVDATTLSRWTPGFRRQVWTQPVEGWGGLFIWESRVLYSVGGVLQRFDSSNGSLLGDPLPQNGVLMAVWPGGYVASKGTQIVGRDWTGKQLWNRPGVVRRAVTDGDALLLEEVPGFEVPCLDLATGTERWTFAIPPGKGFSRDVPAHGQSCLSIVGGDRVLLLTHNRVMYILSLRDGEPLHVKAPMPPGWFERGDDSLFFQQPGSIVRYDIDQLREVERIDYESDIKALYGRHPLSSSGFKLTPTSVVWTTAHGALMAVSRDVQTDGSRRTWSYDVKDIHPYSRPPMIADNWLYHRRISGPTVVLGFEGASRPPIASALETRIGQ